MTPIKDIEKFNKDRSLTEFNLETEIKLLLEELNEFVEAAQADNVDEIVDALCDIVVVAVGSLYKLGYDATLALQETTKEILSRQGAINTETGKWQKNPNQDPTTLYKAQYDNARR